MLYAISFANYSKFIDSLISKYDVVGPVKRDVVSFEKLKSSSELYFDVLPEYTARSVLFDYKELIFSSVKGKLVEPEVVKKDQKKTVILGLRKCDLSAIKKHELAFNGNFKDPYFNKRRNNTLLFGYLQKDCGDGYCFCQSVDLDSGFDLFFYRRFDHYLVETGSKNGESIIREFRFFFDDTKYSLTDEDRKIANSLKLHSHDINDIYDNTKGWAGLVEDCLSCGQCNILCPTCYCFEFKEVSNRDGSFDKFRCPSECQLECFSRVAGNHVFRKSQLDRFKHRIYHQLQYFKERFGKTLCVGCGRCIRHCPTKIDFVSKINEMKK